MPAKFCNRCKTLVPASEWRRHRQAHDTRRQWSPNRDQAAHARFARAVKRRDGGRCVECGLSVDVRACHIVPISDGGSYDPENGRCLCAAHDRATDSHAR